MFTKRLVSWQTLLLLQTYMKFRLLKLVPVACIVVITQQQGPWMVPENSISSNLINTSLFCKKMLTKTHDQWKINFCLFNLRKWRGWCNSSFSDNVQACTSYFQESVVCRSNCSYIGSSIVFLYCHFACVTLSTCVALQCHIFPFPCFCKDRPKKPFVLRS